MKKRTSIFIICFLFVLIISLLFFQQSPQESVAYPDNLKVSVLDVGQADAILIQENDKNILIDAGNTLDGQKLVQYLKENNIKSLSFLVATHPHEDHIGGMKDVIKNIPIEKIYMPDVTTNTKSFEDMLDAIAEKNMTFSVPKINESFSLYNAKFEVLYTGTDESNLNNSSIVLKLTYGDVSFLFMGDATTKVEKELSLDKIDVLKVGHHGSKTSSSATFLNQIKPKYAIISVGKDNKYNLPSEVTINKLNKIGTKIYRTDELGTIVIETNGTNINITNINTDIDGDEK